MLSCMNYLMFYSRLSEGVSNGRKLHELRPCPYN